MQMAEWVVDASDQLRSMARTFADDTNAAHLLTHRAFIRLMREKGAAARKPSNEELIAALRASADERPC